MTASDNPQREPGRLAGADDTSRASHVGESLRRGRNGGMRFESARPLLTLRVTGEATPGDYGVERNSETGLTTHN